MYMNMRVCVHVDVGIRTHIGILYTRWSSRETETEENRVYLHIYIYNTRIYYIVYNILLYTKCISVQHFISENRRIVYIIIIAATV